MKTHAPRPWLSSVDKVDLCLSLCRVARALLPQVDSLLAARTQPPASCAIGSLHCACTSGGGCDPGLACAADGLCASTSCGCNVSRACDSPLPLRPRLHNRRGWRRQPCRKDLATTPPNDLAVSPPSNCALPIEGCYQNCIANKTSVSTCVSTRSPKRSRLLRAVREFVDEP